MTTSSTSRPPAPPTKQYWTAALIMLLLVAGLVIYKLAGKQTAVAPAPPPPTPKTAAEPVFDQPPPAPPPPAPSESVAAPEPGPKPGRSGPAGCGGSCQGEATSTLRAQLGAKAAMARGCYERALRNNSQLQGRVRVSVRVSPNGLVCSARVTQNELGDAGVTGCVLQIFRSSSFAPPKGGCVDVEVPLRFEPKI
jgi:TonB family protein